MSRESWNGSCHCGAVRFEVDADLDAGTVRCNCSICRKSRFWLAFAPAADFRLLQGEDDLLDYRFGSGRIRHRFCRHCGVKPFGMAADGSGVAISLACLDGVAPERLASLPISHVDGEHDCWDAPPAVTSYL
jgi:hypothetical protein